MKTITVNASVTYDVIIGKDVINMLPEKITEKGPFSLHVHQKFTFIMLYFFAKHGLVFIQCS